MIEMSPQPSQLPVQAAEASAEPAAEDSAAFDEMLTRSLGRNPKGRFAEASRHRSRRHDHRDLPHVPEAVPPEDRLAADVAPASLPTANGVSSNSDPQAEIEQPAHRAEGEQHARVPFRKSRPDDQHHPDEADKDPDPPSAIHDFAQDQNRGNGGENGFGVHDGDHVGERQKRHRGKHAIEPQKRIDAAGDQ